MQLASYILTTATLEERKKEENCRFGHYRFAEG
jgi:hypothetical protein